MACVHVTGVAHLRPSKSALQTHKSPFPRTCLLRRLPAQKISHWHCRATPDQEEMGKVVDTPNRPAPAEKPEASPPPGQAQGGLQKGQTTAIVTGIVSILFGVAYLALVQLMDSRGDQLLPPPPEAFGL